MKFSGKRLRRMREREKMSQFALAMEIDTSQGLVSAWERGQRIPSEDSIGKLCIALKCEEADLYE